MIDIRDVRKDYVNGENVTHVLKGVTFRIERGEYVAIMGPSGSGKSTLMHILGALDTLTGGSYTLDGQDVSALAQDDLANIRKTKIGFVFQAFHLLPRATVLRNVALPLVYAGMERSKREERAAQALTESGIEESLFLHHSNQLSGGQMQRVAIARALVNDPAIILADEPTGNLDSATGDHVLETFRRLNDGGRTVVLITHEPYVAEHAERILTVRDGLLVEGESPYRHEPAHV